MTRILARARTVAAGLIERPVRRSSTCARRAAVPALRPAANVFIAESTSEAISSSRAAQLEHRGSGREHRQEPPPVACGGSVRHRVDLAVEAVLPLIVRARDRTGGEAAELAEGEPQQTAGPQR